MLFPSSLTEGALIRVVAPSGPFDDAKLKTGLDRLQDFRVEVPETLWGRKDGYFAGSDAVRLEELQNALDCPEAGAIWVARGGYGIARLLPQISWNGFKKYPKWIVGFSDVTALHCAALGQGFVTIHGPNGTTLPTTSEAEFAALTALLSEATPPRMEGLQSWSLGRAEGPLFGGNLTVLFAEAAAGRLTVPDGSVLFLEDVTETSYRIDRMLSALEQAGHFSQLSGVALGDFTDCSPGKFGVLAKDVLRSSLGRLGLPVVGGVPSGHGSRNSPLILGARTTINAGAGTLEQVI